MLSHDVIIRPIITEKTMGGMPDKKYTFKVAKSAGKIEIAKAVEKVNTVNVRGRLRRRGRTQGYTPAWKKAYVTLKKDSKGIEFFEGMV